MKDRIIIGKIINKCYLSQSNIHGIGVFCGQPIIRRRKIGSLSGILVSKKTVPKYFSNIESISIVELSDKEVLDSRKLKNDLCFINHSCNPNCFMRILGNIVEVYALKNIKINEELTLDYSDTHHDGKLRCKCNQSNCKGWL